MKILVVRFRQMGDALLTTSMLNALREEYPDAQIDFVLNIRIASLFEGHPAISNIITFTDSERHSFFAYIKKVWNIVHATHYDAIIDMRSTVNTALFSLFSLSSKYRIGLKKSYTKFVFNYLVDKCGDDESMLEHNMKLAAPLTSRQQPPFTLAISDVEKYEFGKYMESAGIDLSRPIMLAGVTAKLAGKTWDKNRMADVLTRLMNIYPDLQIIFNYAPGQEEKNAREIYQIMKCPKNVWIDVQARSSRQLAAMSSFITFYFGNEGGARHIVQAMGKPSYVICAPGTRKKVWLPSGNGIPTEGISAADIVDKDIFCKMDAQSRYDIISADIVWEKLLAFCKQISI